MHAKFLHVPFIPMAVTSYSLAASIQRITLVYFLDVLFDGHQLLALTDSDSSTCITLSESYFQTRAVATFILKKTYTNSVDLSIHGRYFQCELSPKICRGGFTTTVLQQGRTKHTCIDQPTPCSGAETCVLLGMTSLWGDMVSCRYRCICPTSTLKKDISCEVILFSIGTGARSKTGDDIELCSFDMEM